MGPGPDAVVLDLDGVLVDSEERWDGARRALVAERGGRWTDEATHDMLGMSSPEWSRYVRDELGVDMAPEEINADVVRRLLDGYGHELPLLPGAVEAVRALAQRWPLGLASSSNARVIATVLERAGIDDVIRAWVSSEEVARGKPAPDVYVEAARRLGVDPARCVAVEDSSNGLRSAAAAGMAVVAVPMRAFPPAPDALALATVTVDGIAGVTPEVIEAAYARDSDRAGR
ncbi:MAG TPA: HAD family phosphatase [Solirubrobacteraceae bacterium]|jgi:HAD superfamily hydrolase (TIGR01509 family)|nr:HAD family phosphatase [Solirubrobacteraceae bacterium]